MHDEQALIIRNNAVELAVASWLDAHGKTIKVDEEGHTHITHTRTSGAYEDTITQYRAQLALVGADLDSDVRTLALVAQSFAASSKNEHKDRARPATFNQRLAILSSFYEYALSRYLLAPMDEQGHILNPMKIVTREKVEAYQGIHWLEPDEAAAALRSIDRATKQGKRDYALLVVLLSTGRRLSEVASLQWQHIHMKGDRMTITFEHCKGDKTMRDTLSLANSRAVLDWLHRLYGRDLGRLAKDAPLWVVLSRNMLQAGQPLGIQGIQQICQKVLRIHAHATRHTFSNLMIKAGATMPELKDRLGHESLATTGIYAAVFTADENPHAEKITALLGIEL